MGSQLSRILDNIKKDDHHNPSEAGKDPLEDPPVPPPPDPRLPLTARQLFNISKSWKGIARAMEPTGITMFVRLFEENEDILHMFQKFQLKRTHDFHRESLELAQHASIVMSTLDESIRSLHNVDRFLDHLHSVGKLHRKIPGFQRDYFWRIERPFLAAVQDTLGERYTENMEAIYKITIRFVLDTVVHGFDLGGPQPKSSVGDQQQTPPQASARTPRDQSTMDARSQQPPLPDTNQTNRTMASGITTSSQP